MEPIEWRYPEGLWRPGQVRVYTLLLYAAPLALWASGLIGVTQLSGDGAIWHAALFGICGALGLWIAMLAHTRLVRMLQGAYRLDADGVQMSDGKRVPWSQVTTVGTRSAYDKHFRALVLSTKGGVLHLPFDPDQLDESSLLAAIEGLRVIR